MTTEEGAASPGFLAGGGLMGELIRGHDWTGSLGPPAMWSPSLRNAVRFMLTARHPVFIFWGREHICLYNDAYSRFLGPVRHPAMLGAPGKEMWRDIWAHVAPSLEIAMRGEGSPWHEDECIPLVRDDEWQELYWTYNYSPIEDDTVPGGVGGAMVVSAETTHKVITLKIQAFRLKFELALRDAKDSQDMFAVGTRLLGEFLGARRCGYGEIDSHREHFTVCAEWTAASLPPLPAKFHLTEFGAALFNSLRDGALVAIQDPTRDEPDVLAPPQRHKKLTDAIGVPLFDTERLAAALFIFKGDGLAWNDQHKELIREAAVGIHAAVARWRAAADKERLAAALRASGARYRMLAEASADFVFELPASGQFATAHAGWSKYTGQSAEQQLGWGWLDAVHPDDQDRVAEEIGNAFEAQGDFRLEYRVRGYDDNYRSMRIHAVAELNTDGSLRCWVCAHRAIKNEG